MIKDTTIRVNTSIQARLDLLRGKRSKISFIDMALRYFEITGIDPANIQTHPSQEVINRIDSSIRVTKGIEKKTLVPMMELLQDISLVILSGKQKESSFNEQLITDDDIEKVVRINDELSRQLENAKKELAVLRDHSKLYELVDWLIDEKNWSDHNKDNIIISASVMDAFKNRYLSLKKGG